MCGSVGITSPRVKWASVAACRLHHYGWYRYPVSDTTFVPARDLWLEIYGSSLTIRDLKYEIQHLSLMISMMQRKTQMISSATGVRRPIRARRFSFSS